MKKICIILLSLLIVVAIPIGLTACNNDTIPEDYKIGYQTSVYPTCEFDYRVSIDDDYYTIHIKTISMTLIVKNEISEDTPIDGYYFPYVLRITAEGSTTPSLSGKKITLIVQDTVTNSAYDVYTFINEDGSILWDGEVNALTKLTSIQFYYIFVSR